MKRVRSVLILLSCIMLAVFAGSCSAKGYKDGVYSEQAAEFAGSGWKEIVEITIENGKLIKINWDAIYKDDTIPIRKKQYSKSGLYGMMVAGSISEWYDQAIEVEKFVLKNGVDALNLDEGGYSDAVSSCTIHMNEFAELFRECIAKAKR